MTNLPTGWITAPLGEICHIEMGQAPPSSTYNSRGFGLPFLQGKSEFGDFYPTPKKYCARPTKVGKAGSVLLSVRAPVGPTNIALQEYCIGRGLASISPLGGIPSRFILWALRAYESTLTTIGTGSTFTAITKAQVLSIPIKVPPLDEQFRIVEKIESLFDEIDRGVESLRAAKTALDLYRKSLLKAAFDGRLTEEWRARNPEKLESPETLITRIREERKIHYQDAIGEWEKALAEWRTNGKKGKKPTKPKQPKTVEIHTHNQSAIPATWVAVPLGSIAFEAVLGKMLDQKKNRGQLRPYLGNINLRWGSFNVDQEKTIPIEEHEVPRYGVRAGDLIVCEGGEPGRCAVWEGDADRVFIQKALHRIRFTEAYCPKFAYYFFSFAAAAGLLEKHFTGSTIKHLTGTAIAEVPLPVCSPLEQTEIVCLLAGRLAAVDELQDDIQTALASADLLRQSILKRAFAGQLVPQDPADQPAKALLETLKAARTQPKRKRLAPA